VKETYHFKEPTNRSHPILVVIADVLVFLFTTWKITTGGAPLRLNLSLRACAEMSFYYSQLLLINLFTYLLLEWLPQVVRHFASASLTVGMW